MSHNEDLVSRECVLQMFKTRMASRQAIQRLLKNIQAEITFEMLQVLMCLKEEQGVSQQRLAECIAKDKACITNLIANLEKKGFVRREENQQDRRNKLVFLTVEGEEFNERVVPLLRDYYQTLENRLGKEGLKETLSRLKILQNAFESY